MRRRKQVDNIFIKHLKLQQHIYQTLEGSSYSKYRIMKQRHTIYHCLGRNLSMYQLFACKLQPYFIFTTLKLSFGHINGVHQTATLQLLGIFFIIQGDVIDRIVQFYLILTSNECLDYIIIFPPKIIYRQCKLNPIIINMAKPNRVD